MIESKKLFNILEDWKLEATLAEQDEKPEVAAALRYFIGDLYTIIPLGELNDLRTERENKSYVGGHVRKKITGDHRF